MRLIITAVLALASACVVYSNPCGSGLTDCGGYCADLRSDERDCGACGAACAVGDYCVQAVCIVHSSGVSDAAASAKRTHSS